MEQAVEDAVIKNENIRDSLCVAVDGSCQKRGHVGIVSVTSVDSGKALDIQVILKFCQCANKFRNQHSDTTGTANYVGSSNGMEVGGAVEMIRRSVSQYNAKYTM